MYAESGVGGIRESQQSRCTPDVEARAYLLSHLEITTTQTHTSLSALQADQIYHFVAFSKDIADK